MADMAFTTYTELKAALALYLDRTDLTEQIPGFIALTEAKVKRVIDRSTTSTTIYISAANMDGPTDMKAPLNLRLSTSSYSQDKPLTLCTPTVLAEVRARAGGTAGRPTHYAFYDEQLQFAPVPDQSYDGILLYTVELTPLSSGVASNLVLAEAPDVYVYGSLMEASGFLEHDERVPGWKNRFEQAMQELNEMANKESYSGAPQAMRLPRVIG